MDTTPAPRADILGLRGLSVALVVAYHLQLKGARGGYLGVDVFFVLSGFLMMGLLWRDRGSPGLGLGAFLAARVARILPALSVLVISLVALGSVVLPPFDLRTLAEQGLWALAAASNLHFMARTGYNTRTEDDVWLLHTWSLSVEWQFYLLFPLLVIGGLAALRRLQPQADNAADRRALLGLLLALLIASLGAWLQARGSARDADFFLLVNRAWELLAGALVWLFCRGRAIVSARGRTAVSVLGLTLLLGSAALNGSIRLRPLGEAFVPWGPVLGACLVLAAQDVPSLLWRQPWLQWLGRISFSLYLWHWPVVLALRLAPWTLAQPLVAALVALALSLLLGYLSWRFVEQEFHRRPSGTVTSLRRAAAPLGLALAALVAAAAAFETDGLAWRDRAGSGFYRGYAATIAPWLLPPACGNFRVPARDMAPCTVERNGSRRILVIGDSHAQHLWAWFQAHSPAAADFYSASECPPVPRFDRLQPGYDCRAYAADAWARALDPAYDTVVVSARWSTVGLRPGPPYCAVDGAGRCAEVADADLAARVRDEIGGAMRRVLAAGKVLVVLDGGPEADFRVAKRVARELYWHGEVRLSVSRASIAARNGWIDPLFDDLTAHPRFRRVSAREILCDAERCRVFDAATRRPVFYDDTHFDPLWLIGQRELLAPALAGR